MKAMVFAKNVGRPPLRYTAAGRLTSVPVTRAFLLGTAGIRRAPIVGALSQAAVFARLEPSYHWHTPIAWTGYILLADAFVWKRRGASWLRNNPAELFFLACASVPLWLVFEHYNGALIRNWYYTGLPEQPAARATFGYAWSFATIWPAMFETGELIVVPARPTCPRQPRRPRSVHPFAGRRAGSARPGAVDADLCRPAACALATYLAAPGVAGIHPAPRSR